MNVGRCELFQRRNLHVSEIKDSLKHILIQICAEYEIEIYLMLLIKQASTSLRTNIITVESQNVTE